MKLGPVEIRRTPTVTLAEPTLRPQPPKGASGTLNQDGYLQSEEYNQELTGKRALRVYDEMRRSDPAVREALQHIVAPITNAAWDIEPASDEPADLEIAAAVKACYFDWPTRPWRQHLTGALRYLPWGRQVFEIEWQVVEAELSIDDPAGGREPDPADPTGQRTRPVKVTLPTRQWLGVRQFGERLPRTIEKWNMDGTALRSVTQQTWVGTDFREVEIEADRLLVFVNEMEGDDWEGLSLLRSAYKPWWLKQVVEKVAAVAAERHGVGINVAYVPQAAAGDTELLTRVENMMRDLRSGEFSYLVFPGPKGTMSQTGNDGYFFEVVTPSTSIPDLVGFLEYLRGDIKGNVLARFAELGHGSVGARATGDVQSQVWLDALHSVASYICDVHNMQAIPRIVRANFGPVSRYPRLVCTDIESRSLEEFAAGVAKLVVAGAMRPDASLRAAVRKTMDLPDEDDPAMDDQMPDGDEPDVGPTDRKARPAPEPDEEDGGVREYRDAREDQMETIKVLELFADTVAKLAQAPAPAVGVSPVSLSFDLGKIDGLTDEVVKLATKETPAPQVNIPLTELVDAIRELGSQLAAREPDRPPEVNVNVPAAEVTVNVPELPAPVVNVAAPEVTVNVEAPPSKAKTVELRRGKDGKLDGAVVKEV